MTTHQMLRFCGSVLGPALIAQAAAELMTAIPASAAQPERPDHRAAVDALLQQAFPDGLSL